LHRLGLGIATTGVIIAALVPNDRASIVGFSSSASVSPPSCPGSTTTPPDPPDAEAPAYGMGMTAPSDARR